MESPNPCPEPYANKYAILCENPCDRNGTLATLDSIVDLADCVVPDTSIVPTVRKDIQRITPKQALKVCFLYDALNKIFADPKVRMHPAVYSELKSHLHNEQAAAQSLGSGQEFQRYRHAIDKLAGSLPKPAEIPSQYAGIFSDFQELLAFVDTTLELRNNKRHFNGTPTTVDLQNLAYALTLSVAGPGQLHVLLARDIDYERLFDKTIGLSFSSTFSLKNRNAETTAKKLGNPALSITNCDQDKPNQPYTLVRNTASTPIGSEFNWEREIPQKAKDDIIQQMQISLARIIHSLHQMKQDQTVDEAALPAISTGSISTNDIRSLYTAMRVTGKEIEQKHEQGRLTEVLDGYRTIFSMATSAKDEQTLTQLKEDLKSIEKYLLVTQKKEAITASNVNALDNSGKLEQVIDQQRRLRETAKYLGMETLANAASQSLGMAKGYIKRMQSAAKKTANELGAQIESMTSELADLRAKQERWRAKDAFYEQLREALKGEVAVEANAVIAGQPERRREGQENYGELIYKNLSVLLGHAPAEGEQIAKKYLVQALGIARTNFSKVVRRAGVGEYIPTASRSRKPFVFLRQVMDKLGRVLAHSPPEINNA